jgi:small-conductance mechanosensitive channel
MTQESGACGANKLRMDPSFWQSHGDEVSAAITMVVAIAFAFAIDRFVLHHADRYAGRVSDGSRAARTRLRVVRRLIFVVILIIGGALALSQFTKVEKLATGILASSAVVGLVVGLAARQVLANPISGLVLAVTQPLRIGDKVTIEDVTGRVDDLTLSYTFVDPGDGRLMIVPNEKVVTTVLFNRSTGDRTAPAGASVWVPADANLADARNALERLELSAIEVAESTAEGIRVDVKGPRDENRTQAGDEEAKLRERAHGALREAGIL